MKILSTKKKSTTGWYYGLKLHLICDMNFNLAMFKFTAAKEDDRVVLDEFFQRMANENKHKKKDQQN